MQLNMNKIERIKFIQPFPYNVLFVKMNRLMYQVDRIKFVSGVC